MMNLITLVFTFITNVVFNLINMVRVLPLWEKSLVVALFFVPIPFTMEGYFVIKAMVIKFLNKREIA